MLPLEFEEDVFLKKKCGMLPLEFEEDEILPLFKIIIVFVLDLFIDER
jgi:hypothetical protein